MLSMENVPKRMFSRPRRMGPEQKYLLSRTNHALENSV